MKYNIFLLFLEILYNLYNIISVKALIGQNTWRVSGDQEFLAVVALLYREDSNLQREDIFCSGVLITQSNILSCEHCFDISASRPYVIIAESNDIRVGKIFYPSWWMSYDQWCITRRIRITEPDNDIAVIKIFVHVAENIIPLVRTENRRNIHFVGRHATAAGWGIVNTGQTPMNLHAGNVTVIRNSKCNEIIERIEGTRILISAKFLCTTANPYVQIAPGDSGNPLLIDGILVAISAGVVPRFNGSFHPEKANAHLSIERYKNYIDTLISER